MRTLRGSCCHFSAGMQVACVLLLAACGALQAASDLRVSANGHYLETTAGTPFFVLSDTEWLLNRHTDAQVLQILDDRRAKGFTVVQVFATRNWSQTDVNGNLPFINNDPTQFNAAYWDRWRWIVDRAAERGLHFLLVYGEPGRKENPWMVTTNAACYAYGRLVGDRFKDKSTVIFCNGQDSDANGGVGAVGWRAMAEGVADGVNGQNNFDNNADYSTTLMTYHGYSIYQTFQQDAWIDFYGQEVWHNNGAVYDTVNTGYNLTNPTKPIALLEGTYEDEPGNIFPGNTTPYYVRVEAWHALFSGGCGYGYGNYENWVQFSNVNYLNDPGAQQMGILATFMKARAWWNLVPDQGIIASGVNSGASRKAAMKSTDGTQCCIYYPVNETAGIRMDRITTSNNVTATWTDPRNGNTQAAGSYDRSQAVSFQPPAGWEDGLLVLQAAAAPAALRVLPLGDSITQADASHQSYRYPLWKKLVDANITVDFVGSLNTNYNGSPSFPDYNGKVFDRDHEGHWGWRADEILNGLSTWLNGYTPDVVLMHVGSNDMFQGQTISSTVDELSQIIDRLRAKNPNVKILLAKLISPTNAAVNAQILQLNAQMDAIATAKNTVQSPVIVVDQNSGFDPNTDTYDGTHPNPVGEEKMAQKWLGAMTGTSTESGSFVKGINLNGPAVTIEGNQWLSYAQAQADGFTCNAPSNWTGTGSYAFPVNPVPDTATLSVLQSALYYSLPPVGQGFSMSQPIGNGTYDVYLWMIENHQANYRDIDVKLEGATVATAISDLPLGSWLKYGPYRTTVSDGTLNIDLLRHSKGDPAVYGLAIFSAESDTQAPTAPANLSVVSKTSGSVSLTWSAATDNVGVAAYDVLRNNSVVGTSAGLSYTDTGLSASTTYSYTVKARDAGGNVSVASNAVSATTDAVSVNLPIKLHPNNGHYFLYRNKTTILVTSGEHYGAVINLDFDYIPYLNELQAKGLNLTRTWGGAYCEASGNFGIQDNTLAPLAGRFICPWARSSTPGYPNGGNKFDLNQWDAAYFARLKDFVAQASARGVIIELTLFCPFYDDSMWNLSPMNAANNINGIGTVGRTDVHTLNNGNLMAVQEAYVRKLVTELRDYDNVMYEICNEPYFGGVTLDWQARIADIIADAESSFANKHLITQNIANGSTVINNPNAKVSVFNFHYCRPPDAVGQNYGLNRVIGCNETGFDGSADVTYRTQGWDMMIAGGALYNNLDYSFTPSAEDGSAVPNAPGGGSATLRTQLGHLKRFLDGFNLTAMSPNNGIIQGGVPTGATVRALVESGKQYAIYVKGGTQASLSVSLPAGTYRAEWVNTKTGAVDKGEDIMHGGGNRTIVSPAYTEDIALRITGSATPPPPPPAGFYRAINLNGPALTIDGNPWEGKEAPNYSFVGSSFENQAVTLNPSTDANRATMIRSSIWNHTGSNVTVSAVPTGDYRVYLYFWEDNSSQTFDISLEGKVVQASYASGAGGHWDKLGPWDVSIADGTINVTCTAGDANLSGIEIWAASSTPPPGTGSGTISRQVWTGVSGTGVASIPLTTAPAIEDELTSFEAPTNWADNYGTRVRGYVHPPVTGAYTFWIASDDGGELWLSSDADPAHKTLMASIGGWTNSREWTKYASQQSVAVNLAAGQKYYIEALQKEGGGGDNLAVAWQGPGIAQTVIEGQYLSPYVAATPPGTGNGLWAEYFDNMDFTNLRLERVDPTVNFDWGSGAPDASLGADTFSVRWTGEVEAPVGGSVTFYTSSDDGVRLWVNNQQVINNWTDHGPTENSGTITLVARQRYPITMEFYENGGGAVAKLLWSANGIAKQVVPQERLYAATPIDSSDPLVDVTSIVLKGTADGTGSDVVAVRLSVNGGAAQDATLTNNGANWEKEVALLDGANQVQIQVEDASGNIGYRTVLVSK